MSSMKSSSLRIFHDGLSEIVFYIGDEFYYKAVAPKMLEIGNELDRQSICIFTARTSFHL